MTEKRFDIVVQDKVARTIKEEITGIGNAARGTRGFIAQLKTEMTGLAGAARAATNTQAVATAATRTAAATASLTAQNARAVTQIDRMTAAQSKAALANERVAQASAKTALAQQRVATEAARTAEAQSKANMAYLREEEALNRAVAAEQKAIASKSAAAVASSKVSQAYAEEERALNSAVAAEQRASAATARNTRASSRAAGGGEQYGPPTPQGMGDNAASTRGAASAGLAAANAARNIREVGTASKLSTQYAAQLGFQLNDIGVSLASGQKPLTVFIQQGAQIAQIPAQAGLTWKQFGQQVGGTLGVVKRTGDAALDAAAAQAASAAKAIAAADAVSLGNIRVTETEVALATAQSAAATTATEQAAASARLTAANEALAAANGEAAVTAQALATAQAESGAASSAASAKSITNLSGLAKGGIVALGVMALLGTSIALLNHEAGEASGLKTYTKEMGYTAKEVKKLNAVQVTFTDSAKGLFIEFGKDAKQYFADAFGIAAGDVKAYMKDAIDFIIDYGRKGMAAMYALVAGTKAYLAEIQNGGIAGIAKSLIGQGDPDLLKKTYGKAFNDADAYLKDLGGRSIKTARGLARKRQDEMAAEMYNKPHQKKEPKGWDRAQELKNANAELDEQIKLTAKYGDELDRANQLEQIAKKFRDHNVPLTTAETAALEAKIIALQEGRRVQEAMTAADEAVNGPAKKYAATVDALNNLLAKGAIGQSDYAAQMRLASRAFDDATDPLAALNRELQRNGELMGVYGRDKDVKSYIQQLEQAAEAQGKTIYKPTPTAANDNGDIVVTGRSKVLNDDAQGMVDEYKKQQKQSDYTTFFENNDSRKAAQDPNSDSYVLDHAKELYAELDRLREGDVISETEAAQRKKDLDRAYLDARLSNTSQMLGQLVTLQGSKNKEMAALGKAAAIAQATIDGYRAVQAALAGPPGPPWSFAIAGVTGAMAAVNVAKIAGVGFQQGGYTGNMATNKEAGVVHGQEYVFDAAATARIGVPALEAMRRGSTLSQPANNNTGMGGTNVIVRPMPGVYMEERRTSTGEIEMIAARVVDQRAGKAAAEDLKRGGNSHMGRAVGAAYGLKRADR
jgi:hypothetical protein